MRNSVLADEFPVGGLKRSAAGQMTFDRHAALLKAGAAITVEILPLQRGAPIFLPPTAQLREIAKTKMVDMNAASEDAAVSMLAGSARSMYAAAPAR